MRGLRWSAAICLLVSSPLQAAFEEPPLPAWTGDERKLLENGGWVPGAILLTEEPIPDLVDPVEKRQEIEQATAAELAEKEPPPSVIAEEFLPAYFAERPKSFVVDPQKLLTTADFRDRLRFLEDHAADSSIDLFIYVFKGDQDIPGEVREEEMIERFFSEGRTAAIVYYYLGAPQRSVVYLSPSLTDVISAAEQRRALQSSVMKAFESVNAPEQLEAFLVQMSIRIYWMERMMEGDPAPGAGSWTPELVAAVPRGNRMPWLGELGHRWGKQAGAAAAGLAALAGLYGWIKRRSRYRFPEFEVEPRLGGAHAAGVGAVISFASASVPPASQRDQVPDYLRRA